MPFVIEELAPNDETVTRTFTIEGEKTEITYYRNRLTLEGDPEDDDGSMEDQAHVVALRLCQLVRKWDWTGPVKRLDGSVAVEAGKTVPLEPETVRLIPLRFISALNEAIIDRELRQGNGGRRRKP